MGQANTFTASGRGSLALGAVFGLAEIAARVITFADLASIDGGSPVRRLHHQAWYGCGLTPTAGPTAGFVVITWHRFVALECETSLFTDPQIRVADTLYWDVFPGGVMYFEVDW